MTTTPLIGVINAGSSSVKAAVFAGEDRVFSCVVEGIRQRQAAPAKGSSGNAIPPPAADPAPATTGGARARPTPGLRAGRPARV